jgi:hypothetical protein
MATIEYEQIGLTPAIQEVKNCAQFIRDTTGMDLTTSG